MAHGGRARGEMGGGEQQNLVVTRVGGWGEAWGGGPCRAGKVGTRKQCGSNKRCTGSLFSNNWSDLAGDEGGGGGRWPMEGATKSALGPLKT